MGDPSSPQPTPLQPSLQPSLHPSQQLSHTAAEPGLPASPAQAHTAASAQWGNASAPQEEEQASLGVFGGARLARTPIGKTSGSQPAWSLFATSILHCPRAGGQELKQLMGHRHCCVPRHSAVTRRPGAHSKGCSWGPYARTQLGGTAQ